MRLSLSTDLSGVKAHGLLCEISFSRLSTKMTAEPDDLTATHAHALLWSRREVFSQIAHGGGLRTEERQAGKVFASVFTDLKFTGTTNLVLIPIIWF